MDGSSSVSSRRSSVPGRQSDGSEGRPPCRASESLSTGTHPGVAPGVPRERALEHLSDRIWRLHQRGEAYGLTLRGITRPVQRGRAHRDACLQMLALA